MNIQLTKYLERLYVYPSKSTVKKLKKYKLKLVTDRSLGHNTSVYELEIY